MTVPAWSGPVVKRRGASPISSTETSFFGRLPPPRPVGFTHPCLSRSREREISLSASRTRRDRSSNDGHHPTAPHASDLLGHPPAELLATRDSPPPPPLRRCSNSTSTTARQIADHADKAVPFCFGRRHPPVLGRAQGISSSHADGAAEHPARPHSWSPCGRRSCEAPSAPDGTISTPQRPVHRLRGRISSEQRDTRLSEGSRPASLPSLGRSPPDGGGAGSDATGPKRRRKYHRTVSPDPFEHQR